MVLFEKVGIVGSGNYGTAIAQCFSRKAHEVLLLSDANETVQLINELHINPKSLPGVLLNSNVRCTGAFEQLSDCEVIFLAVPAASVASVCRQIINSRISVPIVLCSKGFDGENGRLLSELVEEILTNDYAIFSGPSFASEIAPGLPAGVNIASKNSELALRISSSLSSEMFKIKMLDDHIGLQVAGALKNVLAIGCGIFYGLKLGNSAVAQLITEGLREISALSVALGGNRETILELGGVGDVVLTCTSRQSRNVLFGENLAGAVSEHGRTDRLAEGSFSAKSIPALSRRTNMPIQLFSAIYRIIHVSSPPITLLRTLASS
ncbi:MAG: NAD(P)H-dependent glycerol-3-phosphate dehydrogenase [Holosporaceae bacterium]|jgi:glycerol-3-phosphate dehydrogenase (NAD(P)+)|nr:NAD(P)H-dependent glycerol-3-phosphate dehydrogenase [Holosporaceae bacterium]